MLCYNVTTSHCTRFCYNVILNALHCFTVNVLEHSFHRLSKCTAALRWHEGGCNIADEALEQESSKTRFWISSVLVSCRENHGATFQLFGFFSHLTIDWIIAFSIIEYFLPSQNWLDNCIFIFRHPAASDHQLATRALEGCSANKTICSSRL